jgi:hypothetical protein
MNVRRTLFERLLTPIRPKPVLGFAPPPTPIDDGLWILDRRLRMPGGLVLPTRTTIIQLRSRGLLIVSPPPVEVGGLEGIDHLGAVEETLAPNTFHHLHATAFHARYPDAKFRATPGLFARVGGLPRGEELTERAPASWTGDLVHEILGPVRGNSEVALFHRPSRTLVLTDVAFNMVEFPRRLDRLAWRLIGAPIGFGPSRTARRLLLRDRALASAFLARVLAWPFRRVLVAHGDALDVDAHAVLVKVFASHLSGADRRSSAPRAAPPVVGGRVID